MKTIIYHSADFDGIFCREIAKQFLGPGDADDPNQYIGWNFGDEPLKIPELGEIYVLDLPVDRVFGFNFATQKAPQESRLYDRLIWIDHHKTSIETHPKDIPGYRIDGVAACRLAWQWFTHDYGPHNPRCHPIDYDLPHKEHFTSREVSEPIAVRMAGEYDIWDKRDPDAEVFQFGLRSRELTPEDWTYLLKVPTPGLSKLGQTLQRGTLDELLDNGRLLQGYQQQNDAAAMKKGSYLANWEGLRWLVLNTVRCNSLTFASLDVPETGHDALMGYYFNGKEWVVSLYHAKHRTELDLSVIAKAHGGGGHKGACGFQAKERPA